MPLVYLKVKIVFVLTIRTAHPVPRPHAECASEGRAEGRGSFCTCRCSSLSAESETVSIAHPVLSKGARLASGWLHCGPAFGRAASDYCLSLNVQNVT